jgi:2-iminobutanoate/2-iminopropanoate deaminase
MKEAIFTEKAPRPLAKYSQAIRVGKLLFISGQVAIDPETGILVGNDIKTQTIRVIENIMAIIKKAGGTLDNIVKINVYLADAAFYREFNEIYNKYFKDVPPARTTIATSLPGKKYLIEMDAIAYIE